MMLFDLGVASHGDAMPSSALHRLKVVALAVVAQAVWGMARNLCPDAPRITIMAAATCFVLDHHRANLFRQAQTPIMTIGY